MSTKHNVTFLLFCSFALLTVSTQPTADKIKEGETYTIKIIEKIDPKMEIKWTFTSPDSKGLAWRKNGKDRETIDGATIETNGALKLQNVNVSKTGKYTYRVINDQGSEIAAGSQEIIVYAKTLKPKVEFKCHNGSATLTCNTQMMDKRHLTITWSKGKEQIEGADKTTLHQTSTQLLENKEYSCTVRNPVSETQSDSKAVSCADEKAKMGGVIKPTLKPRSTNNPDVFDLICEYEATINWNCSNKEKLQIRRQDSPKRGEFLILNRTGNPEVCCTCTLTNAVSRETSDPLCEKDLFPEKSNAVILGNLFPLILIVIVPIILCLCSNPFYG